MKQEQHAQNQMGNNECDSDMCILQWCSRLSSTYLFSCLNDCLHKGKDITDKREAARASP